MTKHHIIWELEPLDIEEIDLTNLHFANLELARNYTEIHSISHKSGLVQDQRNSKIDRVQLSFRIMAEILCSKIYLVQVWNLEGWFFLKNDESDIFRSFDFFVEIYVKFVEHFRPESLGVAHLSKHFLFSSQSGLRNYTEIMWKYRIWEFDWCLKN